ncbi:hypothetical protein MN116_009086 [Schistosoma mekongi]|uniref:UV excision repair protein RAD23 n=1 Tax=Schistosoma mekongi TaxID=38744 RepID=A0AAE1Z4Y9_SCHME|nr:hypothetical protein MN116_009086 [Schistosoma mekongi]
MKVTFKTLKQQSFILDLQEDDLVGDVKRKIEAERGSEFAASAQKLIHSGKVMEDSKSLKDYKVTDSGFVVVMSVSKLPRDIVKEASTSVPSNLTGEGKLIPGEKSPGVDVIEHVSGKRDSNPQSILPTLATTPPTAASTLSFLESSLATGENFESVVYELVSMGFEKPLVIQAMRAGFNNPDRAFEYLSSGKIPNIGIVDQPLQKEDEGISAETLAEADTPVSESVVPEDPIAALASLPQFQQMRALVQADPELLPQLIQQIGNDNAELFELIQENQQAFLEFLNTPVTRLTGQRQINLTMTAEERAAVDRLKALGFPEELVIQAYYACEKNEDAAANFLLSESLDDEMV